MFIPPEEIMILQLLLISHVNDIIIELCEH